MSKTERSEPLAHAVGSQVDLLVRPVSEAPRWWHCDTHGPGKLSAWGCPDCVAELRRWKSTHAPRLEALEGLLHAAQHEAAKGAEAISSIASERAANAVLTEEIERLRAALEVVVKDWTAQFERNGHLAPHWVKQAREALGPNEGAERRP